MIARMAGEAARVTRYTYDEYLALEREADQRFEWLDGAIYAMAGGTLAHGALSAAMVSELRNLALACGCVVFSSDAKVRVVETQLATYPDASVVCGPIETAPDDPHAMRNPTVLVEVLSESTEAYDRGDKWAHYRRIPSLRHYVLVTQHERRIEVFTREGDHWALREAGAGASVAIDALGGSLSVDRVYAGITLPEAPVRPDVRGA
jgi:Uma2 family endonuclease